MKLFPALVVAAGLACATATAADADVARKPLPPNNGEPAWQTAVSTNHARLREPFFVDGIAVTVDRMVYVPGFADGTPPDLGARVVEVEFHAYNPNYEDLHLFDRMYAYARMDDGTDTDGEGLSFYPLDGNRELGDIVIKSKQTLHARFDIEVPDHGAIAEFYISGPIDGAKVVISPLQIYAMRTTL